MDDRVFPDDSSTIDELLIREALEALREKTAIEGKLAGSGTRPASRTDVLVDLIHENRSTRYRVECAHPIDRKAQLDKIRRGIRSTDVPGLLIAPHISRELAEHCRDIGLQFIDTNGNAYLQTPDFFILVTGEKDTRAPRSSKAPKGLTNAAALRVVFALLAQPGHVNATYKDLAAHAGVSLGTAHNVLDDLERRGYLINKGNAARRKLLEPERLMHEWVINYPTALRAKLKGRRFSAPAPGWWDAVDLSDLDVAWGSEVAAMKMTGYLKPVTQTLYVEPDEMDSVVKTLVKQHRIRPDPKGHIEILEKFWHWTPETPSHTAPPLLVYSELLALLDPRTEETAHMIKETYIDPAYHQA
ncbi:type IV toxin-antitoxin system AbiEi family antitoxin [Telluria beijingensis]|uniref:type IV toxin-antitoxin system AbiEi family antitoxin n=1 Tax=Telluria beijingensis TaxID=3068633 RepID=UPI002795508D|nr:type IV toxin-antitoxin system AbiEi family antitoxin [Massilia sp. REN29]